MQLNIVRDPIAPMGGLEGLLISAYDYFDLNGPRVRERFSSGG